MKKKGNVRAVDELGRFVLPIDYRNTLGIKAGDLLSIDLEDSQIILSKKNPTCVFCDTKDDVVRFKNNYICQECLKELKNN